MDGCAGDFVFGRKILEPKLEKAEIENMREFAWWLAKCHALLEKGLTKGESLAWEKLKSLGQGNGPLATAVAAGPTSTAGRREGQHEG